MVVVILDKITHARRSVFLICMLAASSLVFGFSSALLYRNSTEAEQRYQQLSQEHDSLYQEYMKLDNEYRQLNQTYAILRLFNSSAPPSPSYSQIPQIFVVYPAGFQEYATAILRICDRARYEYLTTFWIDFPDVYIFIYTNASARSLSTTPEDYRIYLYIRSIEDMKPPTISGLCHVFGFTHEMAHIMFKTFDSPMFNEGWAYYAAGFRIVTKLYAALGDNAWPQPYNYSQTEGSERFLSQITNASLTKPGTVYAAGKIMYTIDQKYGPGIFASAIGRMEPSYSGMYRYKLYNLNDFKNALVTVTGDASLLDLFSENGF